MTSEQKQYYKLVFTSNTLLTKLPYNKLLIKLTCSACKKVSFLCTDLVLIFLCRRLEVDVNISSINKLFHAYNGKSWFDADMKVKKLWFETDMKVNTTPNIYVEYNKIVRYEYVKVLNTGIFGTENAEIAPSQLNKCF